MPNLHLELYVVRHSSNSQTAIANIRAICEQHFAGRCALEIIDIVETPWAAEAANILVTPTLIRRRPLPVRRIIGDLSERELVLEHLGFEPPPRPPEEMP